MARRHFCHSCSCHATLFLSHRRFADIIQMLIWEKHKIAPYNKLHVCVCIYRQQTPITGLVSFQLKSGRYYERGASSRAGDDHSHCKNSIMSKEIRRGVDDERHHETDVHILRIEKLTQKNISMLSAPTRASITLWVVAQSHADADMNACRRKHS